MSHPHSEVKSALISAAARVLLHGQRFDTTVLTDIKPVARSLPCSDYPYVAEAIALIIAHRGTAGRLGASACSNELLHETLEVASKLS